jgi:hypothetical protein
VRLSYTNPLKLVKTKHGALGKREHKLGGFRFNHRNTTMGREPFAAERSAALVRTSILWTDDRLESQEEIMENLVTRRIFRRSLLGLLGVLAVSPKRSRAEAWWRTLDATAFPQANGDDRH